MSRYIFFPSNLCNFIKKKKLSFFLSFWCTCYMHDGKFSDVLHFSEALNMFCQLSFFPSKSALLGSSPESLSALVLCISFWPLLLRCVSHVTGLYTWPWLFWVNTKGKEFKEKVSLGKWTAENLQISEPFVFNKIIFS